MKSISQLNLLDVSVHKVTIQNIIDTIYRSIDQNSHQIIANHNLHSVYLYHYNKNSKMVDFYKKATYTHIDGMSLVFLGKILGHSLTAEHRMTMLDLIPVILTHAVQNSWRVYYLGTKQDVLKKGIDILKVTYPRLNIDFHNGYFNTNKHCNENKKIIQLINDYKPNILLVGMGMPLQEEWIVDNLEDLRVNIILNTGAYIDYIAGDKATPPRWLGPLGLEWLYRFLSEPTRLGRRYLIEPWFLSKLLVKDIYKRFICKLPLS